MPQGVSQEYSGSINNLGAMGITAPKQKSKIDVTLEKVMAKKDRIAALPEHIRGPVIDRLFDKLMTPRIPKAINDEQRALIKQRFTDTLSLRSPTQAESKPTEADYKSAGVKTGPIGRLEAGTMEGLSNIWQLLGKISMHGSENDPAFADVRGMQASDEAALKQSSDLLHAATDPYASRHKYKAGAAEIFGQGLPSIPIEMAIPGGKEASLLGKLGINAVKGGLGMIPFDPSVKGVATGAALSTPFTLAGPAVRKLLGKVGTKAASTVATKTGEIASNDLEARAQKMFQKSISDLTPDQKLKLVSAWQTEVQEATKTAKAKATEAKKAAKVEAIKQKGEDQVKSKLEVQKAMSESKALQKEIVKFFKANKRAPTDEELIKLRETASGAAGEIKQAFSHENLKGSVSDGFIDSAWARVQQGQDMPFSERPGSIENKLAEARKAGQLKTRDDVAAIVKGTKPISAAPSISSEVKEQTEKANLNSPDDVKKFSEQAAQSLFQKPYDQLSVPERLKAITEATKIQNEARQAATKAQADQFKVESPEAVKAVAAVADITKVIQAAPTVTKVPEGVSGLPANVQALNTKLDDALTRLSEAKDPKAVAAIKKTVDNLEKAIANNDPDALHRISDAERKALDRKAKAALETYTLGAGKEGTSAAELVASKTLTPEEELERAEESFLTITDSLEELGPQGKEMAKNLNMLWKKPPKGISRQQIIEAGEKALTQISGGK